MGKARCRVIFPDVTVSGRCKVVRRQMTVIYLIVVVEVDNQECNQGYA